MTEGSSRESDMDPAELVGGFALKSLATLRRYSSSTARLLRLRKMKKTTPAIALKATMPTITPAAMPALLGPLDGGVCVVVMTVSWASVWPGAVTTIVLAFVTTDGGPFCVGDGSGFEVDDVAAALAILEVVVESDSLPTLLLNPVN